MLSYLIIMLVSFCAVEAFVRLPVINQVNFLSSVVKKIIGVIVSKRISDHWKEKVLLVYSGKIFSTTLKLVALLFIVMCISLGPAFLLGLILSMDQSIIEIFSSWMAIFLSTVFGVVFYFLRCRLVG